MVDLNSRRRDLLGAGAFLAGPGAVPAALYALAPGAAAASTPSGLDPARVDETVGRFMRRFEIPGLGIAIVAPGGQVFARGYGVRRLGAPERVDERTLFGIGSNTKSVTAAALATLVDDGRIAWDAPVITYLPEFRMYDPAVTRLLTVRDLLCHRSGLPLGGGDLLYFPPSHHVAADVLKALPYLKPARGFRAGYAYDNILYIIAGLVIERVSGQSWRDYVTTRLLRPLGMRDAVASRGLLNTRNVAARHARLGPPVRGVGPLTVVAVDESPMIDAPGGVHAGAAEMTHWLRAQLALGAAPDGGPRFWSEEQAHAMWRAETLISETDGPTPEDPSRPVLTAYALGWEVQDYRGERLIWHTGGLTGQITLTSLLPRRGIGMAVLTNTDDRTVLALRNALIDPLLGAPPFDWADFLATQLRHTVDVALAGAGAALVAAPPGGPSLPLQAYAGRYRDPWYGDILVTAGPAGLVIDFVPTPVYKSPLEAWGPDVFRTHFAKDAGEDALVMFHPAAGRIEEVSMKAFSPLADFSYDYTHLAFRRV